jgi:hypothetical protein
MMGGASPSATGEARACLVWLAVSRLGRGKQREAKRPAGESLGCTAGLRRSWAQNRNSFYFYKNNQTHEFKHEFEFKHEKQCYGMYATVNSYISLFT